MGDDQALVDKMEAVWRSIEELCSTLGEADWKAPTDCPGWSVQDQLAHLSGSEAVLVGRPLPDHQPADTSHVRNPIGERNEVVVDYRRSWPPERVLAEFREVTAERLRHLRSLSSEDFSRESWTPVGPGTLRDFVAIRIFDAWVHEQDIRRAVGRPGHLEGPVARHAFERIASAMPYVVGRRVAPPERTSVVFEVAGAAGGTVAVVMEGGRGRPAAPPHEPTVRLAMDLETFSCLGCGRWDPERVLAEGRVRIEGDAELGRAVVRAMNFMI